MEDAVVEDSLRFDAVILAGGRATRLGGIDKTALIVGGETLLDATVGAVQAASHLVIVGLRDASRAPADASLTREEPPWSGPAAAIGAGLEGVQDPASPWVLVVAGDLAHPREAVASLLETVGLVTDDDEGLIAVDAEGFRQPLLALYRSARLRDVLAGQDLGGLSMRRLLEPLALREVPLPSTATADIDTADDARRLGAAVPDPG